MVEIDRDVACDQRRCMQRLYVRRFPHLQIRNAEPNNQYLGYRSYYLEIIGVGYSIFCARQIRNHLSHSQMKCWYCIYRDDVCQFENGRPVHEMEFARWWKLVETLHATSLRPKRLD